MSKQAIQFAFGQVSQDTANKHILPGGLTRASNVLRGQSSASRRGPLTKRKGFSRSAPAFTGASWTNNAESLTAGNGSTMLARDGAGRRWAYDSDANTFRNRGTMGSRAYAQARAVFPVSVGAMVAVEAGNNTWFFAIDRSGGSTSTPTAYWTVVDTTTGIVIQPVTSWTMGSAGPYTLHESLTGAYDNSTYVWVFDGRYSYRFTAATPSTAPTQNNFQIANSAARQYGGKVSARYLSAPGKIAVVGMGLTTGGVSDSQSLQVAYLDTATGGKAASPAPVSYTSSVVSCFGSCRILVSDGTTSWYVAHSALNSGVANQPWSYILSTITTSTLAAAQVTLGTGNLCAENVSSVSISMHLGGLSGYVDTGTGDRVVFATDFTEASPASVSPQGAYNAGRIIKYVRSGSTTTTTLATSAFVASDPFLYGGTWFLMTGFHDLALVGGAYGGAATAYSGLGRCLHLRDSNGVVLNQIRYGDGPMFGNLDRTTYAVTATSASIAHSNVHVCHAFVSGAVAVVGAALYETQRGLTGAMLTLDFAQSWPSAEQLGADSIIDPGPVIAMAGRLDNVHECGVFTSPCLVVRTAGAAATYTSIGICYSMVDADGTTWRSSPYVATFTFGASDTLKIPTPITSSTSLSAFIEIYGGTTTLRLLKIVRVDSTVSTQTVTMTVDLPNGETLYTTGGALSNSPPFQALDVLQWRNRVFCVGSDFDEQYVRYSIEREFGFGPRFNEILSFYWREGTGRITCAGMVDWNYLAFFKRDSIGVITGPGPDGRGAGNYTPQTLPVRRGCTNPASVVTGQGGLYFQDAQTGRICRLGSDLVVVEATPGADDFASETVTCAIHDETAGLMKFYTASRIICLDYRHPSEEYPLGEVFDWSSAGILQAYAATVDNTGPVHMEAAGILRRPETGATYQDATSGSAQSYGALVETGWIQPFGMQSEFSLRGIQFLGEFRAAHTFNVTTFLDYSASGETETVAVTAAPEQFRATPTGALRAQAFRVRFEETSSTGAGYDLEGFLAIVQNRAKNKPLNTTQRI